LPETSGEQEDSHTLVPDCAWSTRSTLSSAVLGFFQDKHMRVMCRALAGHRGHDPDESEQQHTGNAAGGRSTDKCEEHHRRDLLIAIFSIPILQVNG
jgi:hypothetical protein